MLKRRFIYISCSFALLVAIVAFTLNNDAVVEQMNDWQILPREERFTELYFTQPKNVPDTFVSQQDENVQFAIHNLEQQTTRYNYQITAHSSQQQWVLEEGSITLKHNDTKNLNKKVTLPFTRRQRIAIQVNVQYDSTSLSKNKKETKKQTIHYWIKNSSA